MPKELIIVFSVVMLCLSMFNLGCDDPPVFVDLGKTGVITISDPGQLTTTESALSGTVKKDGATVEVTLNPILVDGTPIVYDKASKFAVFVSTSRNGIYTPVDAAITTTTDTKLDIVFILDITSSMQVTIDGCKSSIAAFTVALQNKKADVRYGVVGFGDIPSEQVALPLPATSIQVSNFLNGVAVVGGNDSAENPLDSIIYAYNNFTWRSDAQKVFIVLTDQVIHQRGDGGVITRIGSSDVVIANTLYNVEDVLSSLEGKATICTVSPVIDYGDPGPWNDVGKADVRCLSDGYGWYLGVNSADYGKVKTSYSGTGTKWVELPASGALDLSLLGIDSAITRGYTIKFTSDLPGTVLYVHIIVDTNGDGLFNNYIVAGKRDSDGYIVLDLTTSSIARWLPSGQLVDRGNAIINRGNH